MSVSCSYSCRVHPPKRGGFYLPHGILDDIFRWGTQFINTIDEIGDVITGNRIWKELAIGIGRVTAKHALDYSFSGVMFRGSGIAWDLKKAAPYDEYDEVEFDFPVDKSGNCNDHYMCRVQEMQENLRILRALNKITPGLFKVDDHKLVPPSRATMKESMKSLMRGILCPPPAKRISLLGFIGF